ncbi:MAG: translation initiation factor IF-3 [Bacteroidetes bacterium]|nr:translation initiation factor IF-3 [Bacteroidota bacterium]
MSSYKNSKFPRANKEIQVEKVRLVDSEGEMIGVVTIAEAIKRAAAQGLDLVEISPNAEPPVCKLLDFSRYKYDSKKKQQEAKKKQKKVSLKEMKFKVNIGQGDFDVKVNKIRKFLEAGDKVKVSLWFKGREIVHRDKGLELFKKILESLGEVAKIDAEPKMEGKQIIMILSPNVPS